MRTVLKFKKVLKGAKKFLLIFASLEEEIRFSLRSNLICSTVLSKNLFRVGKIDVNVRVDIGFPC